MKNGGKRPKQSVCGERVPQHELTPGAREPHLDRVVGKAGQDAFEFLLLEIALPDQPVPQVVADAREEPVRRHLLPPRPISKAGELPRIGRAAKAHARRLNPAPHARVENPGKAARQGPAHQGRSAGTLSESGRLQQRVT
jgi:hypothetical protein